jgi:hypothetical protein
LIRARGNLHETIACIIQDQYRHVLMALAGIKVEPTAGIFKSALRAS